MLASCFQRLLILVGTNMLKLDMLRLFVDQRLTAVADEIFHRFAQIVSEYESDVLKLKLELSRQQTPLEAIGPPAGGQEDKPAGVHQNITTEEELQVRRQNFTNLIKVEEGRTSRLEDSDVRTTACSEAKPHPTDSQHEGVGVKQEVDEDHLTAEISSQLEGALQNFPAEDEQQMRGLSLILHIQPEARAPGLEGTDPQLTLSSAFQIKTVDEEGTSSSNKSQSFRSEESPPGPSDPLICESGDAYRSDHDWNSVEFSGEHSDGSPFEPVDRSAPGTLSKPPAEQSPLICNNCGREFSSKASLKKHIRNNTSKDLGEMSCRLQRPRVTFQRPSHVYRCRVCGSSFSSGGILLWHAKTHCRESNSPCGVCGDLLKSTEALAQHLQSHKELGSTCDVCGKKWSSIRKMEIHKRIHTGERPYCCDFCSRAFSRKESLERHVRVHTGERPHCCGLCRRSFTRRGYLIHHMNTTHKPVK